MSCDNLMVKCFLAPRSVKFVPRQSLDSQIHSAIDDVLKGFRSASRELRKIFISFRLELELLDRLFYKNKNQHRGALFWRKVTEMRRFCRKLDRLQPDALVEDTRRWFWGPLDQQNSKMLKGSWTHCPDDKSLANVIRSLQLSQALCGETAKRLTKTFEHFLLCLQSAAFAPLLITLCAVSARLNSQVQRVMDPTQHCSKCLTRLVEKHTSMLQRLDRNPAIPTPIQSASLVDGDTTMETVEVDVDPSPPGVPVLFAPLPTPPPTKGRKTHLVVEKTKKSPRDEIDTIFGF